jgi:hypothetical protein
MRLGAQSDSFTDDTGWYRFETSARVIVPLCGHRGPCGDGRGDCVPDLLGRGDRVSRRIRDGDLALARDAVCSPTVARSHSVGPRSGAREIGRSAFALVWQGARQVHGRHVDRAVRCRTRARPGWFQGCQRVRLWEDSGSGVLGADGNRPTVAAKPAPDMPPSERRQDTHVFRFEACYRPAGPIESPWGPVAREPTARLGRRRVAVCEFLEARKPGPVGRKPLATLDRCARLARAVPIVRGEW